MSKRGHIARRRCVGCYESFDQARLVRVVLRDGVPTLDQTGRLPGRGAYLCRREDCLRTALKRRAFQRSWGVAVAADKMEALSAALRKRWAHEEV